MAANSDQIAALAVELLKFDKWAETAHGCDWCCGGGDSWADHLESRREALGFSSWEEFRVAAGLPPRESEYDDHMDGDTESALASAGYGTDEDYRCYGDD